MDSIIQVVSQSTLHHLEEIAELKATIIHLETENEYLSSRNEALEKEVQRDLGSSTDHNQDLKDSLGHANQNALLLKRIAQLEKRISENELQKGTDDMEAKVKLEAMTMENRGHQNQISYLSTTLKDDFKHILHEETEVSRFRDKTSTDNTDKQLESVRVMLRNSQEALLAARKEIAALRQSYDIRIQNLRMTYEEQLLKVAQSN